MKLIADSGSTKTDWALIGEGKQVRRFSTRGYNPSFITFEEIAADIGASLPSDVCGLSFDAICFYGAGVTPEREAPMREALIRAFPNANPATVAASSDTLGACRALLGDAPGFAAILGTGMNTCIYDGCRIVANVPSLGFVLGDEGSGAYIGRKYVVDFLRSNMPDGVRETARREIGLDAAGVLEQVYHRPDANRWCARFASVVAAHMQEDSYYWNLVRSAFDDFFWNVVSRYPDYDTIVLNCVGSVAWGFRDILSLVAEQYHVKVGTILKSPLDALSQSEKP